MDFKDVNTIFFVLNSTFSPFINQMWETCNILKSFDVTIYIWPLYATASETLQFYNVTTT